MLIAVSGVSGFIGSHVANAAVARGWNCIGLVNNLEPELGSSKQLQFLRLSGSTEAKLQQLNAHKIDAFVHCATRYSLNDSLPNVDAMLLANIQAGLPLLEYSSLHNSLFVNLSSVFQHGPGLLYSPNSFYAATKQAFSDLVIHYVANRGVSALDLCLHDTYGPGDRRKKLIPSIVRALIEQKEISLSSLDTRLNLLFVSDIVRAILTSIELRTTGMFSTIADAECTVGEIIEILERLTGGRVPTKIDSRLVRTAVFPRPVSPRLPGWQPEVDLQQGLAKVLVRGLS